MFKFQNSAATSYHLATIQVKDIEKADESLQEWFVSQPQNGVKLSVESVTPIVVMKRQLVGDQPTLMLLVLYTLGPV